MKKVILTLVLGLFLVAFSNAQSKAPGAKVTKAGNTQEVKKTVDKADAKAYTVKETAMSSDKAAAKSCAKDCKEACCTGSKKSCAGKSKAECATKKAACDAKKKKAKTEMKKTM